MPKLQLLAACEKALIDEQHNLSLIVLFSDLNLDVPAGQSVPPDAVAPKDWAVVGIWHPTEAEKGRKFRQVLEVVYPDGKAFNKVEQEIEMSDKPNRVIQRVFGLPIGQQGVYSVRVWLEEKGSKVTEEFEYPIRVAYVAQPAGKS